ncbi:MAG: AAA family ATPase [Prevotella sp.]|nr:AAA family ATPase [Prevotella sp.]
MNSYIKKNSEDKSIERKHDLPLFASFTTEDIHSTRKIKADKFKQYIQKPSFGYYECLEGNGFLPYWLKRLLVLEEGQKNLHEIKIVRQAIMDALGKHGCGIITKMMIRPNQKKVYYQLTDGREVEAELLSDGYKRLVNIVTDIAFRCALLNYGFYELDATRQTKGIVLIDEIDLHLHPTLQAKILKCLHKAFPKLQFIATTHAPMVMTGVENNEENVVYKLGFSKDEGYTIKKINTYGLDCSTITRDILGIEPRDKKVEESLSRLFCLIDEDKEAEARKLLDDLKTSFKNNLPELARAEAILNFSINLDE